MVKVNIKWNKQTFNDIELDQNESPSVFKSLVMSLTGVPTDRQKLMGKGLWKLTLKDDEDLSKLTIKEESVVTLIGTAEVMREPTEKVVFVEDMTQAEASKTGAILPAGLRNLGNTCYMNSTLQCLRHVPELRTALNRFNGGYGGGGGGDPEAQFLTNALKDTLNLLDGSTDPVPPMQFLMLLRQQYPQFAQQARGHFMQQDAQEFLTSVHENLARSLTDKYELPALSGANNFVDALMGFETEETLVCSETDAEPPVVRKEGNNRLLQCYIQGGAGSDVKINYLHEGLKLALEGQIDKQSEVLGRNALWSKKVRISRLPRYLCIHFMRFFWKATPDSADHAGIKCKSLRTVTFPEIFDIYNFCSETLKARLNVNREKDVDEILGKGKKAAAGSGGEEAKDNTDVTMADAAEDDEDQAALQAALAMSMGAADTHPQPCGPGLPLDFKGTYELFGVVTHKGRTADGGHYMGWVRHKGDDWLVFDDEDVSECKTAEVLQLSGGGDWHMAYMLFYRYKNAETTGDSKEGKGEEKKAAEGGAKA